MRSGACAHDFALVVPGVLGPASRRNMTPRARSLRLPGAERPRGQRQAGPQGLKTPRWSAVTARPARKPVPCSLQGHGPVAPNGAPLPLGSQDIAPSGAKSKIEFAARAGFPQRGRRDLAVSQSDLQSADQPGHGRGFTAHQLAPGRTNSCSKRRPILPTPHPAPHSPPGKSRRLAQN